MFWGRIPNFLILHEDLSMILVTQRFPHRPPEMRHKICKLCKFGPSLFQVVQNMIDALLVPKLNIYLFYLLLFLSISFLCLPGPTSLSGEQGTMVITPGFGCFEARVVMQCWSTINEVGRYLSHIGPWFLEGNVILDISRVVQLWTDMNRMGNPWLFTTMEHWWSDSCEGWCWLCFLEVLRVIWGEHGKSLVILNI